MIRCPLCVSSIRPLLDGHGKRIPYTVLAQADRIVARATFEDWTDRAIHLVTKHNWRPYSGMLAERSAKP